MISRLRDHRPNHRQLVRLRGNVREQFRYLEAALPASLEFPVVLPQGADLTKKDVRLVRQLGLLSVALDQLWLEIKRVDMTHAAHQTDMHYLPGLGRMVTRNPTLPFRRVMRQ